MGKPVRLDSEMMLDFLKSEFPKKRIKMNPRDRRFTPGIIVPATYTNSFPKTFKTKTPSDLMAIKKFLTPLLKRFFGFEDSSIEAALNLYLRIF